MIVALSNPEQRMCWSDSKQAVQKSPMLALPVSVRHDSLPVSKRGTGQGAVISRSDARASTRVDRV
jgi:hypothetical protein